MSSVLTRISSRIRQFLGREDGLMIAEMVIVLPIFLFCTIGMYSYWDGFRSLNSSQKASYTVSDMIARTNLPVDDAYLRGLHDAMQYLVNDNMPVKMRVSSVSWSDARQKFEIIWSRSPYGKLAPLTTNDLQPMAINIPMMSDGDTVIILETTVDFRPAIGDMPIAAMYLNRQDFRQFIVTRPRFVPKVCLVGVPCG